MGLASQRALKNIANLKKASGKRIQFQPLQAAMSKISASTRTALQKVFLACHLNTKKERKTEPTIATFEIEVAVVIP